MARKGKRVALSGGMTDLEAHWVTDSSRSWQQQQELAAGHQDGCKRFSCNRLQDQQGCKAHTARTKKTYSNSRLNVACSSHLLPTRSVTPEQSPSAAIERQQHASPSTLQQ